VTAAEWERRWARPVAIASILSAVLFLGAQIALGISLGSTDAATLRDFADKPGQLLALHVVSGIGSALLAVPVYYLFRAVRAREPGLPSRLAVALWAGAVFLLAASVLTYLASKTASDDFLKLAASAQTEEAAEDAIKDVGSIGSLTVGAQLAGAIGLGLVAFLTSRQAMRIGLLSRFWGTYGMATGLAFILIPYFFFVFAFYLGLLFIGRVPSGRPPAWEAGKAVPWPVPDRFKPREEAGVVEGDGTEIDVGPKESLEPELPEPAVDEPGETQGQRRKKRKRRD
jgi:uncharacterized membrane protein